MGIVVYELHSAHVPNFINDMVHFGIFERVIADTVFGVIPSMVQIVDTTVDPVIEESTTPSPGRRLRDTVPRLSLPRLLLPRWLQAEEKQKNDYDPYAPVFEVVPVPSALERAGVKPDGKAGGPMGTNIDVLFHIMIGDDEVLAWRALKALNEVSMQAITFQLDTIMGTFTMPRSYTVAIVRMNVYPVVTTTDSNVTDSNLSGSRSKSSAASRLQPKRIFSAAWSCAVIGVIIASHASRKS